MLRYLSHNRLALDEIADAYQVIIVIEARVRLTRTVAIKFIPNKALSVVVSTTVTHCDPRCSCGVDFQRSIKTLAQHHIGHACAQKMSRGT